MQELVVRDELHLNEYFARCFFINSRRELIWVIGRDWLAIITEY